MGTGAITSYVDVAQLTLYAFWIFFAGLIYYLQRESKREGFPLETDLPDGRVVVTNGLIDMPPAKTYKMKHGDDVTLPNDFRSPQTLNARPAHGWAGAPLEPVGDPMLAGVGPGAWADRADRVDVDDEGEPKIRPLRLLPEHGVAGKSPDPRGMQVTGGDGEVGGVVKDLWLDQSDMLFRYLEVETASGQRVLVPMNFCRVTRAGVHVRAVMSEQFAQTPMPRSMEQITMLEEERIVAYYGAGTLYAHPDRAEPLI